MARTAQVCQFHVALIRGVERRNRKNFEGAAMDIAGAKTTFCLKRFYNLINERCI